MPLLALGMVLAACSSTGRRRTPRRTAAAPSAAAPSAAAPSAAAGGVTVNLADSTLGKILADGNGKTLYVFAPDAAAAGKSDCNGDCATNWPPLTSEAAPTLGTGPRRRGLHPDHADDGAKQVAFYGHPVYYFKGDTAQPTNGQGVGGKWSVGRGRRQHDGRHGLARGQRSGVRRGRRREGRPRGQRARQDPRRRRQGHDAVRVHRRLRRQVRLHRQLPGQLAGAHLRRRPDRSGPASTPRTSRRSRGRNGATQVTFYGQPLYYFAGDTAAGDTKGQGLGGKWYVVDAEGKMIK